MCSLVQRGLTILLQSWCSHEVCIYIYIYVGYGFAEREVTCWANRSTYKLSGSQTIAHIQYWCVFSFSNWTYSVGETTFADSFGCSGTAFPSDSLFWSPLSDVFPPSASHWFHGRHQTFKFLLHLSHTPASFTVFEAISIFIILLPASVLYIITPFLPDSSCHCSCKQPWL